MGEIAQDKRHTGTKRTVIFIVLGLVLAATIFAAGFISGSGLTSLGIVGANPELPALPIQQQVDAEQPEGVNLDVFWEVWNTVDDRFFYDLPTDEERVQGAIEGLINSLGDPYTAYVPPDVAHMMNEDISGEFEGIGAFVEEAPEGGVYIFRVFEGGPAEQAGLRAGDIVIAVDSEDVTENILRESLLLIRGEAGTDVTLTVIREGQDTPLEFTVTRARLDVPTVESEMLDNNIGYVALYEFNARASSQLRPALRQLLNDGAESIILDLRNNPGGYLDESVTIADMFLADGTIVIQRNVDGEERSFTSTRGEFAEDVPLVVLINQNSASASEIVAAAIKDNGRGTLIGQTTFGKGSVQLQYNLSDGSLLRVTYANWFTPDNVSISELGVEPDIVVEVPEEQTQEDVQLDRAVEFLTNGE
jgi:carboxyl-terminal processing protease